MNLADQGSASRLTPCEEGRRDALPCLKLIETATQPLLVSFGFGVNERGLAKISGSIPGSIQEFAQGGAGTARHTCPAHFRHIGEN